jgi:hypothetical protein
MNHRPAFEVERLPDWPERLAALVEARRHAPFAWGSNDCLLFAADAVLACTGVDPAAAWRGRYGSEAEGEVLMGGTPWYRWVLDWQDARGAWACPPAYAQRGDTALIEMGNDHLLGVVLGDQVAAPTLAGLGFVPLAAARRIWVT